MNTIDPAAYNGDIVSRLRNWRGLHLAHSGDLFEEAADEIAGLRGELAWTARERDSLRVAINNLRDYVAEISLTYEEREAVASCIADDDAATAYKRADTLRSLLSRTGSESAKSAAAARESSEQAGKVPERERLTNEEREALDVGAHAVAQLYVGPEGIAVAATLRTLLERLR
jgi:hypothetical protein